VFLLHALLSDSPADSPAEVKELASNQLLVASRGREPGLMLHRHGQAIGVQAWGNAVLRDAWPVAQALDAAHGDTAYTDAWQQATETFNRPSTLPSARVLHTMREAHAGDHAAFGLACSDAVRASLLSQPWSDQAQQLAQSVAQASLREQAAIEAADTLPFEAFREAYLDPAGLSVQPSAAKA
jgi:glutamate--cysteine ligase